MADFSNRPSNAEMIEYLKNTNVLKLQSAARLAGLRWKSGTPGFDKAGIIEKLSSYSTVYLPATYFALKRQESNSQANPLLDDINEEPIQPPITREVSDTLPPLNDVALSGILKRLEALEDYAIGKPTAQTIAEQTVSEKLTPIAQALKDNATRVNARLDALEARKPIDLHISPVRTVNIPDTAHKSYAKLIEYLEINGRVILTGSAGTGKSMAVKNAADALGLQFYIQTPVTMSHEYLGHRDANGVFHETPTFQAYVNGGVLLWDEADAGLPDAMLAANPIFDGNGFAVFGDGNMYKQHPDFRAVFNMNTDGNGATMQYAGRNRLDGATLARFGVRIHWEIDAQIEALMADGQPSWHRACVAIRDFMVSRGIVDVNATPRHVKTGAALLNRGTQSRETILTDVLKSGALSECWADVKRLPAVADFLRG